jgi:plasmid maintenance system antidote protein VapI
MAKRRTKTMTAQLRQAIDDSGLTRYAIAKATGIDESALSKFYNGQRGINTNTLDKLGECLGLRIVMGEKPEKKGR